MPTASPLAPALLNWLSQGLPQAESECDAATGKFLTAEGGWAVTRQDLIFPLALLYRTPGAPGYNDPRLLSLASRGGDGLRGMQAPDGRWEFIKVDGSRWGQTYMPWSIYHWLECYILLHEALTPERRAAWETGLRLAYHGLARQCAEAVVHNIPAWNGMSLVRAGRFFGEAEWERVGRAQLQAVMAHQHPDGYWPEGHGPSTGYNLVYIHALGLYQAFTGDAQARQCLTRATAFHATLTYPDGSPVETVDGRQRYHGHINSTGWAGFSQSALGRRLVSLQAAALLQKKGSLSPHLASFLQHGTTGPEAALPWQAEERVVHGRHALVRRTGPWFVCASGYCTPPEQRADLSRNRWILHRANLLSIWHEHLGLIVGGGNSKYDPAQATFELWQDGALRLEPDTVKFSRRDGTDQIRWTYGQLACDLLLRIIDTQAIELTFALPAATRAAATVTASLTLPLAAGTRLVRRFEAQETTLEPSDPMQRQDFRWPEAPATADRSLGGPGWRLEVPDECTVHWPAYPFNPYAIDGAAKPADAVLSVSVNFARGAQRRFILRAK